MEGHKMTKKKRIEINHRLMKAFTALDRGGLDVIANVTEYGTWSTFTVFTKGNSERALTVYMTDNSDYVKVRIAGVEKEYATLSNNTIETYLVVFTTVATFDAK